MPFGPPIVRAVRKNGTTYIAQEGCFEFVWHRKIKRTECGNGKKGLSVTDHTAPDMATDAHVLE